ncbi:turripeptide Pal9.2 isoform X2 [Agrilus planipennis]|uniref:Turripeptide Pal9.2 isoform X2 n=1 Tax=Agrilus planipennis TaxID=224129 RepID=A0A1W4XH02_AGRPL|nr:turripeptide Pal9.2 isoform X2 [Agrilus planipennis]
MLNFVLVALAYGYPSKGSTKASLKKKACNPDCTQDYEPVCAGDNKGKDRTFGNKCVLERHNCEQGQNLQIKHKGECPGGGGVRLS